MPRRRVKPESRKTPLHDWRGRHNTPAALRFWAKVGKGTREACWPWLGGKRKAGYGYFNEWRGKNVVVSRYAYRLFHGEIPEGLHIDHLCENRTCVNPFHLEAVTPLENTRRAFRKNVCRRGHAFTAHNSIRTGNGYRRCRLCVNAYQRRRWRIKHWGYDPMQGNGTSN